MIGQYDHVTAKNNYDKPFKMKYDWSVWSCDNTKKQLHIWQKNLSSFGEMKTCFLKKLTPT